MNSHEALVDELLKQYVHHRVELVRLSGSKAHVDTVRLKSLSRASMEKMAAVIADWDVTPDVVMSAAFALARRNKHPSGPLPNMLGSVKYLTNALSNYLQVPYEVVAERRGMASFLERMDDEFSKFRENMDRVGVTDLVSATSYPVELRYLLAVMRLDRNAMFMLAPELLQTMSDDRRIELWLSSRGVRYEAVARQFNKQRAHR